MSTELNTLNQKLDWLLNNLDVINRRQEFLAFEPFERKRVLERAGDRKQELPAKFLEGKWAGRVLEDLENAIFFVHRFPDIYVSNSIMLHGQWEPKLTGFFQKALTGQMGTFLDVGANIGWFSLIASLSSSQISVLAIEPAPENADLFRSNIKFNRIPNVEVIEAAVADIRGKTELHLSEVNRGDHQIEVRGGWRETVSVEMIDLDSLLPKIILPLKWVKMDIQGMEGRALRGGRELIERYRPVIVTEFWKEKLATDIDIAKDFIDLFKQLRYEFCYVADRSILELEPIDDLLSLPDGGIDIVLRPMEWI